MKIKSISAKNFKTLEDFKIDLSSNYCAISGKNNAGKSAIVKIIQYFFEDRGDDRYFNSFEYGISFAKDFTQWSNDNEMMVSIEVSLDRKDDSEVFFVVQTFSPENISGDCASVVLSQKFNRDLSSTIQCIVEGVEIDGQKASEILKKFRSAANLVTHNSTSPSRRLFYIDEAFTEVLEAQFSAEDRSKISLAEKNLRNQVRKATKQHKEELEKLLGKLNEKYQVDLSSVDRGGNSKFPLEIKLTDKSVEVPLNSWGAGTQNRTRVLMSVLEAVRMRSSISAENRSTPVFLVEEPESFLHPSAQAEFGKVLNNLAEELEIQIIATTHSPYMLNQNDPGANFLLERKYFRNLPRETHIVDTSGTDWMRPFSENLGIIPSEFDGWRSLFGVNSSRIVLFEGEIDKEYFEIFKNNYKSIYSIPSDVEIVPYGGKDSLKNTSILQFMINKFGKVFITYDLDAEVEVSSCLRRIGLESVKDFCAVGVSSPGAECIEGLLPSSVKIKIYSEKHELVTALSSQDSKTRNSAKSSLKKAFLDEFKFNPPDEKELSGFRKLFSEISKAFR